MRHVWERWKPYSSNSVDMRRAVDDKACPEEPAANPEGRRKDFFFLPALCGTRSMQPRKTLAS